ncbi:MAG: hypothetical protein P4N59_21730, partial [Negativicutes bacterium]|nr:hypothetical protein [Negativicutes bacterium]
MATASKNAGLFSFLHRTLFTGQNELVTPLEVLVDGYSMEFSKDGVIETLEPGNSVDDWVLYDSSS